MTTQDVAWTRSSRCTGGNCVEIARTDTTVRLRDSKNPDQPHLELTERQWADFSQAFRDGEFDPL